MERIKVKDVIKKLEELDDDDYTIYMEVEPIINRIENCDGTGWETTKYRYLITLESDETVRQYKNHCGIMEYLKDSE